MIGIYKYCADCGDHLTVCKCGKSTPAPAAQVAQSELDMFKAYVAKCHPDAVIQPWDAWQARAALASRAPASGAVAGPAKSKIGADYEVSDNSETWHEIARQVRAELKPVRDLYAAAGTPAIPPQGDAEKLKGGA